MAPMSSLSIVIPVLEEAAAIGPALRALAPLRERGVEVVVVDGGSTDGTMRVAAAAGADHVLRAPRGRAAQMNAGARAARGEILLFLHADTALPPSADEIVQAALNQGRDWGRFDVAIAGADPLLAVVAMLMNLRSRLTGVATGDQAVFARRECFFAAGGFPEIPLMEDVALSKALKRIAPPACLRERVVTSGRRWERNGTLRTILLMWRLRLEYALGADPRRLARRYGVERTSS
jgi:rSAM/selenodomain-associated transferase 2